MTRHGWFQIRKMQEGDRSLDEQMLGLGPALEAAKGKSVLDLGCAEGMISREFGAVASSVLGIEMLADHVAVARVVCKRMPHVKFIQAELGGWIADHPDPEKFDIVLALSIAHKLRDPCVLLRFAARSCKEMLVFRGPGKVGMYWDGTLRAKHGGIACHVPTCLRAEGLTEGETLPSGRGEQVQYWVRTA